MIQSQTGLWVSVSSNIKRMMKLDYRSLNSCYEHTLSVAMFTFENKSEWIQTMRWWSVLLCERSRSCRSPYVLQVCDLLSIWIRKVIVTFLCLAKCSYISPLIQCPFTVFVGVQATSGKRDPFSHVNKACIYLPQLKGFIQLHHVQCCR